MLIVVGGTGIIARRALHEYTLRLGPHIMSIHIHPLSLATQVALEEHLTGRSSNMHRVRKKACPSSVRQFYI